MRLFVVGNGFDLAHMIKSRYWDFGEYLEIHYPKFYINLMAAIGNNQGIWSDFEGRLPECGTAMEEAGLSLAQERLSELDYDPMSDEGMGYWMNEQLRFINSLPMVLRKWIHSVDINKDKVYKDGIFTNGDLYLTFNYTETLEKVYGINEDRILHIHGNEGRPLDELIMGHGDIRQIEYVTQKLEESEKVFADCAIAVYKSELDFLKKTLKNTSSIIAQHGSFFARLIDVDEVVVVGSSLSGVDMPYFKKIKSEGLFKWTFIYHVSKESSETEKAKISAERFAYKLGLPEGTFRAIPDTEILK